jgi:beta-phosphoglucomutase-like phosphatase (HAD superfamily)
LGNGWDTDRLGGVSLDFLVGRDGELDRELIRKNGLTPEPGVANWVRRLHEQAWLQAITSAAPRANIEILLQALSAAHRFQGIVSAEDVRKGKPHLLRTCCAPQSSLLNLSQRHQHQ